MRFKPRCHGEYKSVCPSFARNLKCNGQNLPYVPALVPQFVIRAIPKLSHKMLQGALEASHMDFGLTLSVANSSNLVK